MPIGPITNAVATLIGGVIGASVGRMIPEKLRTGMPQIFGLIAFSLGIPLLVQTTDTLSVVLAILAGVIIGELLRLESRIEGVASKVRSPLEKVMKAKPALAGDSFMTQFIAILILFSASGLGVIGAMSEGMTGDPSLLFLKSILDFCTAIIFGVSLGYMVCLTVIPQIVISLILFYLGSTILPLTTPDMLVNFSAVGGFILLATGFRIMAIKEFTIANMLPALFLIMPIYALLN